MAIDPCNPCGCIPANIDKELFYQMFLRALCQIVSNTSGGNVGSGLWNDTNIFWNDTIAFWNQT